MLELIRLFLAQNWRIMFASAAACSEHRFDLTSVNVEERSIQLNDSSFDDFIAGLNPDMVLFDRFFTEEQFGWRVQAVCPNALRLLDTEDLHSLRHIRHLLLQAAQLKAAKGASQYSINPVLANAADLYQAMADNDMTKREISSIYRSDLSLIISKFEMDFLSDSFSIPQSLLQFSPFLNNSSSIKQLSPFYDDRRHFIALGNFRHEPNWDAVLCLKHTLWPLIRSQLPHADLHIYGAYPPKKATQLHNPAQGFIVKGWADNALEVMQTARVCLAPLRFGAGIKGKLLDALRSGTPSVTTAIGIEGIADAAIWGGEIANDAQTFAAAAVRLYASKAHWLQAQQRGFEILHHYYYRQDHADLLISRINDLTKELHQYRRQNFIGAMLRHELHQSKYYMAKWIEAKNTY